MGNIEKVLKDESQLLTLTGYKKAEFEKICEYFRKAYNSYINHYQIDNGKIRLRKVVKERKNATLPSDEHRLLFVLYYIKLNPLQHQIAFQFGMNQAQVSRKLKSLLPILERALNEYLVENKVQLEQNPMRIHYKTKEEGQILLDVTERPIQRSMDEEQQRLDFSGKKKTLRKKSSVEQPQRIYFIRKPDL